MNNYQTNRYKMYGMVKHFLNQNNKQLIDQPGYREKYEEFCKHYKEIERAGADQNEYTHKKSYIKKELRKSLQDQILIISRRLKIYALIKENETILANCRISRWKLLRLTQFDLTAYGGNLKKYAEEEIENLVPYGITPEMVNSLGKTIDAFYNAIADPRTNQVNSSVATKRMAQEYKAADKALEFIDLVASVRGDSDAGFYSEYKSMRKQLKTGSVKMALKVNAVDAESRNPLANVIFILTHQTVDRRNSKKKFQIIKKTKVQGGFKVMHLPPGKYDVVAKKPGYKDTELEIVINPPMLVKVVSEMEKLTGS